MNSEKKIKIKLIIIFLLMISILILSLIDYLYFLLINKTIMIIIIVVIGLLLFSYNLIRPNKFKNFLNVIIDYFAVFVYAFFFLQLFFNYVLFPAVVNQTSMNPTLYEGNRIIVINGNNKLDRFDVVVFKLDLDRQSVYDEDIDNQLWVKRVIGLPGEKIEYKDGVLYVNNQIVNEPYLYDKNGNFHNGYYSDKSGVKYYNSYTNDFTIEEALLATKTLTISEIQAGVIPKDYYLLLGDNRANSWDSRRIGLVHKSQIIGEGRYIIDDLFNWKKIGD